MHVCVHACVCGWVDVCGRVGESGWINGLEWCIMIAGKIEEEGKSGSRETEGRRGEGGGERESMR